MDLRDEVRDLLEYKINELFVAFQEKLGIKSGDIDPWQANRLDEQMDEMAENITSILHWEEDRQAWMGEACENGECDEPLEEEVLATIGKYDIIKDGYGFGVDDGYRVNRFTVYDDGTPHFDFEVGNKRVLDAINRLIRSGKLNNPNYKGDDAKVVGDTLKYGVGVEEAKCDGKKCAKIVSKKKIK